MFRMAALTPGICSSVTPAARVLGGCGIAESIRPATGTNGPDPNAVYALGSSPGERRLQRQAGEMGADSAALLDRVGLQAGQARTGAGPWMWLGPCQPTTIAVPCRERIWLGRIDREASLIA